MERQQNKRLLSYKSSSKVGVSDRRVVHAHNKSVEWKNSRSEQVNRWRNIPESMTPIDEQTDSVNTVKNKHEQRSELLKKWKEQKELKQKLERLEQERSNPMFKVKKVAYARDRYLLSKGSPVAAHKQASQFNAKTTTSRSSERTSSAAASTHVAQPLAGITLKSMTRSAGLATGPRPTTSRMTKGAAHEPKSDPAMSQAGDRLKTKPTGSTCSTRVTRQRTAQCKDTTKKTVPQKRGKSNAADTKHTDPAHSAVPHDNKQSTNSAVPLNGKQSAKVAKTKQEEASKELQSSFDLNNKFVTNRLDSLSFAPEDFTFSAPANLTAFQINPLSPNSAANFLYSGIEGASSYFISPNLRRCSTPKIAIKRLGASAVCSPADTIPAIEDVSPEKQLPTSNTPDNDVNKSRRRKGRKSTCITPKHATKEPEHADLLRKSIRKSLGSLSTSKGRRSLRLCSSPKSPIADNESKSGPSISDAGRSVRLTHDGSVLVTSASTDVCVNDIPSPERMLPVQRRKSVRRSVILTPPNSIVVTVDIHAISPSEDTVKDTVVNDTGNSPREKNDIDSNHEILTTNTLSVPNHPTETPHTAVTGKENDAVTLPCLESVTPSVTSTADIVLTTPCSELQENDFTPDSLDVKIPHISQPGLVKDNEEKVQASEASVHTPVSRPRRHARRSVSLVEPFIQPRTDVVFWSAKQASSRKRKSLWMQNRKSPVQARSPEEWVNILLNSPMIEMERRHSKVKSPKDTALAPLPIDFEIEDDVNIGIAAPAPSMSLFSDFVRETSTEDHNNNTSINTSILNCTESALPMHAAGDNFIHSIENTSPIQTDHCGSEASSMEPVVQSDDAPVIVQNKEESNDPPMLVGEVGEHTVPYFRELLLSETRRLTSLCEHWQAVNEDGNHLTEEVSGQIRTTVGQGHLLMNQRFKQFTGLVDDCEFKTGEKETTCTDLQGFWDMIYFQVGDVNEKFAELDKRQANNWVTKNPEIKPIIKPKLTKPLKASKNKPVKGKSKFAAFRQQMKTQKQEDMEAILKGATPSPKPTKAFEGGFFKVATPIQQPRFHCEGGSPAKENKSPKTVCNETDSAETRTNNCELNTDLTSNDAHTDDLSNVSHLASADEEALFNFTPKRRSYLPVVPSPLLQDITPGMRRRQRRQSTPASRRILRSSALFHVLEDDSKENVNTDNVAKLEFPDSSFTSTQDNIKPARISDEKFPNMMTTDTALTELLTPSSAKRKRRSSIQSASVLTSVNEEESGIGVLADKPLNFNTPEGLGTSAEQEKEDKSDRRASKRRSLRRSIAHENASSPPAVDSQQDDLANILAKYLVPTMSKQEKTSSVLKSSLKKKISPRKCHPQRHSVHFGSPACAQSDLDDLMKLPCTPYNRNSIVQQQRVNQGHSLRTRASPKAENTTPVRRRSTRPSFRVTSPQIDQLTTAENLISFSP